MKRRTQQAASVAKAAFAFVTWTVCLIPARGDEFIAGADISHLAYFESLGIEYRDSGVTQDALSVLVRIRKRQQAARTPSASRIC